MVETSKAQPDAPGSHEDTGTRRPRVHQAWWVLAVALLVITAANASIAMPGVLTGPLHEEFHWSRGTIGFAASVNLLFFGLTAPFSAALMDRFGIRRVVVGALGLIGAGAALTTVMTQPWQMALYWGLLIGLGSGSMATTFAATVANRWFVRRRGLVTGLLGGAAHLGQLIFLPGLAWIVEHFAWRPGVVTLSLAALVMVPLVCLMLRDHPADTGLEPYGAPEFIPKPAPVPGAARRAVRVLADAARTRPFWLLVGTFVICGATTNGIQFVHFTPAAHDHGMPMTVASSLLAAIGIFSFTGTIASGWLTDRLDPRWLLAGYYSLRGLTLILLPLVMTPDVELPMLAFVVVYGLIDVATVPPTIALCRERYGLENSPIVFGWITASHQMGAGLMAVGGGMARDTFGSYTPVWMAAGGICATAALMVTLVRHPAAAGSSTEGDRCRPRP